jgi:hypothetical protein
VITPIGVLGSYTRIVLHDRQVASIEIPPRRFPVLDAFCGSGASNQAEKCLPFVEVRGSSEGRREEQAVTPNEGFSRTNLKTPKAAAIAGMLFSLLTVAAFWLLWISVPADPQEPGSWLGVNSNAVALGLNLVPFAGIAFLWFIGVLRDRLGQLEDRFFATVFFGSGLLFLGLLFTAAAVVGAILMAFAAKPAELIDSATFHFARAAVYGILNIYLIKMAGVFMITTSTVAIYTGFAPRWLAVSGYVLSLLLLFGSYYVRWSFVVFPLWVFLISLCILVENLRRPAE